MFMFLSGLDSAWPFVLSYEFKLFESFWLSWKHIPSFVSTMFATLQG